MISDDEANQAVSAQAFELLHLLARRRLEAGRLAVIDATNTTPAARRALLAIAEELEAPAVAIILDVPAEVCRRRDASRQDRRVGADVIRAQAEALTASLPEIGNEGFDRVYLLLGEEQIERCEVHASGRADGGPGEGP